MRRITPAALLAALLIAVPAAAYEYGTTPTVDIPATGEGGWGPKIEQAYKDLVDFNASFANPDGTLKAPVTATPWQQVTTTVTYVSATSFSVDDTYESYFETGRKVWINQATDAVCSVASASTAAGVTTVTVAGCVEYADNATAATVTTPITDVSAALATPRNAPASAPVGWLLRPSYSYATATALTISAGAYQLGAGPSVVSWSSPLTFNGGPAGSNTASSPFGTSQWQYLYIDASSVTGGMLTAANFLNSTTAPTWSGVKRGWYNGDDRCVFAYYVGPGGNQTIWYHDGGTLVRYYSHFTEMGFTAVSTTHTAVTLTVPSFSSLAVVTYETRYVNALAYLYAGEAGGAGGHYVAIIGTSGGFSINTTTQELSSAQQIDVWFSTATTNTAAVYTNGFFLSKGL